MYAQWYKFLRELFLGQTSFPVDFPIPSTFNAGENVGGAGVTVREQGNGGVQQTIITLDNVSITMTDATTAGSHGTLDLYEFSNNITFLGASATLSFVKDGAGISDTAALVFGVGSAAVGTGDSTLTGTEQNIVSSTAATLAGGEKGPTAGASGSPTALTGAPVTGRLNLAIPDAGSTANAAMIVSGTITITWTNNVQP